MFATLLSVDGVQIGQSTDSIDLDTRTQVNSFVHGVATGVKLNFGDRVTLTAKTGEPRGRAVAAIEGYDTAIVLLEGGAGCTVADVGCYGLTYQLTKRIDIKPTSSSQTSGPGTTTVNFTDESGNVASARASSALEIAIPPVISSVQVIPDLFSQTAVVKFTTDEIATGIVRPGQFENSLCTSGCPTTALGTTHQVTITGAQAGEPGGVFLRNKAYFVRVDATDAKGNLNGSAVLRFFLQPDPPKMVVPIPMDSRVLVRWEAPPQEDLAGFFVERSENGGAFVRISGATPYNHEVLTFDDRTVVNGRSYVYRVRAVDFFGNASESATTTDMAKNTDGTVDATKLAAFSACGTATPTAVTSTAGTDIAGGVLPLCAVWTKAGSPFRVNGSIAVPTGGVLIVGPNLSIQMANNPQVINQGRLALLGDRGTLLSTRENSFVDEDAVGFVSVAGVWQGIRIANAAVTASKVSLRGYRAGDLVYRVQLLGCTTCLTADSGTSIVRSAVAGALTWTGGRGLLAFSSVTGAATGTIETLDFTDGNSLIGQRTADRQHDSNLCPATAAGCNATGVWIDSRIRGTPSGAVFNSDVFMPGGGALGGALRSSRVTASGNMSVTATEMKSTQLIGNLQISSTNASVWDSVNFISGSCLWSGQLSASFGFGSTLNLTSVFSDCLTARGDNLERITDFQDDVTRGSLSMPLTPVGAYPRAIVNGPQLVNLPSLRAGITLRIVGDDLEDGPLPASAGYWTNAIGIRIGDGPLLTLPTTMIVGITTFTAHVVDSSGQDAAIPWPVEVKNEATLAGGWIWPDRERWRAAALRFDQLPKANATSVATFRWRCFAPDCTTTCALDPDSGAATAANFPCRSPLEVAALALGPHTFIVQPRDASGNAIDLPQTYTWSVSPIPTAVSSLRLRPQLNGDLNVEVVASSTSTTIVTCGVDSRAEVACSSLVNIGRLGPTGFEARELVVRVRDRATGAELGPPRLIRLNDPDDRDGDGWLDGDDPCLAGAARSAADCAFDGASELCGNGIIEGLEKCDDGNSNGYDGCSFSCQTGRFFKDFADGSLAPFTLVNCAGFGCAFVQDESLRLPADHHTIVIPSSFVPARRMILTFKFVEVGVLNSFGIGGVGYAADSRSLCAGTCVNVPNASPFSVGEVWGLDVDLDAQVGRLLLNGQIIASVAMTTVPTSFSTFGFNAGSSVRANGLIDDLSLVVP